MKGIYRKNNAEETTRKLQILKNLQSVSLDKKISIANDVIEKSLLIGAPALLYSGGKDSTVLLNLLLKYKKDILIIHNNTTLGNPDYLTFLRGLTKNLNYVETTAQNPIEMWQNKGYYPILSKRGFTAYKKKYPNLQVSPVQCCYQLKEIYSNKVLKQNNIKVVFWGNRAGESIRRRFSFVDNGFLFKPKKYNWHQSYPLQHFTDVDIIKYLTKYIPDYPINNNLENGCLCCGTDLTFKNNSLRKLFFNDKPKWEYYMLNGFAKNILIAKGYNNLNSDQINDIIYNQPAILFQI